MDEAFYSSLANELAAKVGRVSSFVKHGPSIGSYHEQILRSVLRPMLPDRYSLRTGFAFHPEFGASQQGDILVVDENQPAAYFFREGNFAVVDQSAIMCVIEVKTRLDKRSFVAALDCLASYQRVTTKPQHPGTLLFAYDCPAFTQERLNSWYKAVSLPDEILFYPWSIFALNRGLLSLHKPADPEWGHYAILGEPKRGPKLKGLAVFLQTVRKLVLLRAGVVANPFAHLQFQGLSWSKEFMRFQSGVCTPAAQQGAAADRQGPRFDQPR